MCRLIVDGDRYTVKPSYHVTPVANEKHGPHYAVYACGGFGHVYRFCRDGRFLGAEKDLVSGTEPLEDPQGTAAAAAALRELLAQNPAQVLG